MGLSLLVASLLLGCRLGVLRLQGGPPMLPSQAAPGEEMLLVLGSCLVSWIEG